jgi:hypothetical protein
MKSRTGLSYDTLDRLRKMGVKKAYSQPTPATGTTGLRMYDLRGPAMRLNPVVSTFRNLIPRKSSPGGTAINWKAITGINTGNILPGVSEGNRNAPIAQTTAEYFQTYAGLGMENFATFEAVYAMRGFSPGDARAMARLDQLESLINAEERVILGGNQSVAFGVPGTPTGSVVGSGGALTAQTWVCYVVALTFEGMLLASVAGGVSTTFVRTNADGSTDTIKGGSSNKSAEATGVATTGVQSILWVCPSKPGAAGYAWYVGLTGAANCRLAAITTTSEFLQTTNPGGGNQQASVITADNSQNALVFDGIITQIAKNAGGTGAYVGSLAGAGLTVGTSGTVDAFDAMFEQMFDNSRTGPQTLYMNPVTQQHLTKKVMAQGGGTPNINISVQIGAGGIKTGVQIESVLNPYTGQFVPIQNHPFMPKGMILAFSQALPYTIDGPFSSRALWEIETRQEYYSIDWPLRTRKYESGTYVDEALIGWVPSAQGLIQDIDVLA